MLDRAPAKSYWLKGLRSNHVRNPIRAADRAQSVPATHRDPVHEPVHEAVRPEAEPQKRRRRRAAAISEDRFYFPVEQIHKGSSYEWKRYSTMGQEDPFYIAAMREQGWEPVDPKRHVGYSPDTTRSRHPSGTA